METTTMIEHSELDLTTADRAELGRYEAVIQRGLSTFVEVGNALAAIRDSKLYRGTHGTFLDYCRERWGLGRSHVYRLMDAAIVAGNLGESSPMGEVNERVLRPLTRLEPEQQREAYAEAVADANGDKPTAAQVEKAVAKFTEPKARPPRQEIKPLATPKPAPTPPPAKVVYVEPERVSDDVLHARQDQLLTAIVDTIGNRGQAASEAIAAPEPKQPKPWGKTSYAPGPPYDGWMINILPSGEAQAINENTGQQTTVCATTQQVYGQLRQMVKDAPPPADDGPAYTYERIVQRLYRVAKDLEPGAGIIMLEDYLEGRNGWYHDLLLGYRPLECDDALFRQAVSGALAELRHEQPVAPEPVVTPEPQPDPRIAEAQRLRDQIVTAAQAVKAHYLNLTGLEVETLPYLRAAETMLARLDSLLGALRKEPPCPS